MTTNYLTFFYLSLPILSVFFSVGWYYCFHKKFFSWLDFMWSASFLLIIIIFHVNQFFATRTTSLRPIDLLYAIWSIRLSTYLFLRLKKHGEDKRYIDLKNKWKVWHGINFFILFQVEAIFVAILSIPLTLTYSPHLNSIQIFATCLLAISLAAETLADEQLSRFIKNNKDSKKVCDIGLWKYSRHPNYFFEWINWVSIAIYGLSSDEKWPAIIPPILMYLTLTKMTGIPYAEASSLKSKQENYRKYQRRTNSFFPWFPKKFIAIIILITSYIPLSLMAGEMPMQQSDKIKYVFSNLRADNLQILNDFYDPETIFIDPIGEHKGIDSVRDYYKNLYLNVNTIEFNYTHHVSSENSHSLYWTMILTAKELNGGKPVIVDGNSHIKFNDKNLVIYHRDYFDMGQFIYEDLPIMGWAIKKIKSKLRGAK